MSYLHHADSHHRLTAATAGIHLKLTATKQCLSQWESWREPKSHHVPSLQLQLISSKMNSSVWCQIEVSSQSPSSVTGKWMENNSCPASGGGEWRDVAGGGKCDSQECYINLLQLTILTILGPSVCRGISTINTVTIQSNMGNVNIQYLWHKNVCRRCHIRKDVEEMRFPLNWDVGNYHTGRVAVPDWRQWAECCHHQTDITITQATPDIWATITVVSLFCRHFCNFVILVEM